MALYAFERYHPPTQLVGVFGTVPRLIVDDRDTVVVEFCEKPSLREFLGVGLGANGRSAVSASSRARSGRLHRFWVARRRAPDRAPTAWSDARTRAPTPSGAGTSDLSSPLLRMRCWLLHNTSDRPDHKRSVCGRRSSQARSCSAPTDRETASTDLRAWPHEP